jgi:hypothetical protein
MMGAADVNQTGQNRCGWQSYRGQRPCGVAGWPRRGSGIVGSGRRGPRRAAVGMALGAHQVSTWLIIRRRPTSLTPDSLGSGLFDESSHIKPVLLGRTCTGESRQVKPGVGRHITTVKLVFFDKI